MFEKEFTSSHSAERHMLRGSIWLIGVRWSLRLLGLASTVILARLLTPADYGVVAIAMTIVGMVELFNQTGQDMALIRHPNPTREHYDSAWTVSLLIGLGLGTIALAGAPLTTWYFHEPRAEPVVAILALRIMMIGCQNVRIVSFQRNFEFHKQFLLEVMPSVISLSVTIVAAFLLRTYWSLVIGIISLQVSRLVISYVMVPYRPRIAFSKVREIWSFSIWALAHNLGTFVNDTIDKIAIGGFAGTVAMGRYDVARDIAVSPTSELISPITRNLFPVMVRIQGDKKKRRELFLTVLSWSALICAATSVGVALVAQDMADVVLGPKWHDIGVLMPWFALSWGVLGLCSSVYAAFNTIGRPIMSARLQWMRVLCLAAAVIPVAYFYRDLEKVVITRFVVTLVVSPALFYALSKAIDVPMRSFAAAIWRPVAASLAMTVVVLSTNAAIDFTGVPRLVLDIAAGGTTYSAMLMLLWFTTGCRAGPERALWDRLRPWLASLDRKSTIP